jgi:hypothetical protein
MRSRISVAAGLLIYPLSALAGEPAPPSGISITEAQAACFAEFAEMPSNLRGKPPLTLSDEIDTEWLYRHEEKCLTTFFNNLRPTTQAHLSSSFGAILRQDESGLSPFCFAFRTSSSQILTAKHCIAEAIAGKIYFSLFGDPAVNYEMDAAIANARARQPSDDPIPDASDFVFLDVDTSHADASQIPPDGFIEEGIWLLIPTFAIAHYKRSTDKKDWRKFVRFDAGNACFSHRAHEIGAVSEPCIIHMCQTNKVTSGSPIYFVNDRGELRHGGMHIRSGWMSSDIYSAELHVCGRQPRRNPPPKKNLPYFGVGIKVPTQ